VKWRKTVCKLSKALYPVGEMSKGLASVLVAERRNNTPPLKNHKFLVGEMSKSAIRCLK
jgi:hypothetical protein